MPKQGEQATHSRNTRDHLGRRVNVRATATQTELRGKNVRTVATRKTIFGKEVVVSDNTKYHRHGSLKSAAKSGTRWW